MQYLRLLQNTMVGGRTAELRVLLVATSAILVVVFSVSALANPRDLTHFAEYLRRQDLLEQKYDTFLETVMNRTLRDLAISKPVKVNQTYSENHINIYAVRKSKRSTEGVRFGALDVYRLLTMIANNGVALPPNVVLIDSDLLGLVIVNACNNVIGLLNAQTEPSLGEPARVRQGWAARAVDERLRFGNIRAYLLSQREPKSPDTLGPTVASALLRNDVADWVYMAVFTLLGHEVAHLRLNHPGNFASWEGVIQ
jgi:hypothetical protein